MSSQLTDSICQALLASQSNNNTLRIDAENFIKQVLTQEGALEALLTISTNPEVSQVKFEFTNL